MATAKPCSENCGMPVKKAAVTPHRQTGAESGNHAADNRLHNAYPAFRHSQLNVVSPQRGGKTAPEHADNHHTVDAGQRRAVQMNKLKVTPLLGMYASELQQLPTPAGELPVTAQKVPVMPK